MISLWLIACASRVVALVAWSQTRRLKKRFAQQLEMYWELKYQQGELRVRVQRMTNETPQLPPQVSTPEQPSDAFVPLSSLKR